MTNHKAMELSFVYCGYDFMLESARRMIAAGHELSAVWTFACDNRFNFNRETHELAARAGVPVHEDRPDAQRMRACIDSGANFFLAAGYPYKIPDLPPPPRAWGVNIHPSLLPMGRGLMPAPYILTDQPQAAGWSIHKITPQIDGGDILTQAALRLLPGECVETYGARAAMESVDALMNLLKDWPRAWDAATPQDESKAGVFPPPSRTMRSIEWSMDARKIERIGRAFGRFGCLALVQEKTIAIYSLDAWSEKHGHAPGSVVFAQGTMAVIACADGYVCIKEYEGA